MCYNLTAWNWQCFTWASPCNWQQGNSARKPATFALSFLFWRVIITLTIMLLLDWYTSAQVRNEKNWKSPLRLFCVSQETNQPTHASHFRWITVKQARPHSLYATLKIVYVRWTNQTSDSKLLPFYINLHVCYPPPPKKSSFVHSSQEWFSPLTPFSWQKNVTSDQKTEKPQQTKSAVGTRAGLESSFCLPWSVSWCRWQICGWWGWRWAQGWGPGWRWASGQEPCTRPSGWAGTPGLVLGSALACLSPHLQQPATSQLTARTQKQITPNHRSAQELDTSIHNAEVLWFTFVNI